LALRLQEMTIPCSVPTMNLVGCGGDDMRPQLWTGLAWPAVCLGICLLYQGLTSAQAVPCLS
jgi:hypothetical protein